MQSYNNREGMAILAINGLTLSSHNAAQTEQIGEHLGHLLRAGDVICLEGDLGAGKTCLTKGIGRGLGVSAVITSPTFIIINEYPLRNMASKLYHIDLYRVETIGEAYALGLEDYFYGNGICVIEWAERVQGILPAERLWVTLHYVADTERRLEFRALGQRYTELLQRLRECLSFEGSGVADCF